MSLSLLSIKNGRVTYFHCIYINIAILCTRIFYQHVITYKLPWNRTT